MPRKKLKNIIIADHNDWLEIDISTKKFPNAVMAIDKNDWLYIQSLNYGRVIAKRGNRNVSAYASCCQSIGDGKSNNFYIHHLLFPEYERMDHADRNGLNNRRKNVRECTYSQNMCNRRKPSHNTSGYKGVSWMSKRRKWRAKIRKDKKDIFIGDYKTPEEAYEAYCGAAKEIHGEFACIDQQQNSRIKGD